MPVPTYMDRMGQAGTYCSDLTFLSQAVTGRQEKKGLVGSGRREEGQGMRTVYLHTQHLSLACLLLPRPPLRCAVVLFLPLLSSLLSEGSGMQATTPPLLLCLPPLSHLSTCLRLSMSSCVPNTSLSPLLSISFSCTYGHGQNAVCLGHLYHPAQANSNISALLPPCSGVAFYYFFGTPWAKQQQHGRHALHARLHTPPIISWRRPSVGC